jgi:ATP-dependent helicase/nuclease subunit A
MTIHDAKGQEFPAVFVPGLSKDFNLKVGYGEGIAEFETIDTAADDGRTPLLGIRGPGIEDGFAQEDTILKRRLKFARKREAIAEEKRILYVAMTRARDHLYLVGTAAADDGTMASIETGNPDSPSNWYDFLGSLLVDDATTDALDADGEYAWHGTSEVPLRIRLPRTDKQLPSEENREAPSLSADIPDLETEPTFSIPASYLGSLINDGAPGDVVIDHSGRHVSYVPPNEAEESSEEDSSPEYLPRAVFGSALHKAVELEIEPNTAGRLRQLLKQFAVQADVSLDRIGESDISELQRHLRVARDYLANLDAPIATDERRVHATLEDGETYGDIDHLIVTDDAYHIVDYKTNKITDEASLDDKAQHYEWQMLAYAVALYQTDSARNVKATLLFTEVEEARTFSWTPEELNRQKTSLNDDICRVLELS